MFRSILVPLDGSNYSERALTSGLELARITSAKVTLVSVILAYKDAHVPPVARLDAQAKERAETYLAPFLEDGRRSGFDMVGLVAHGEPAEEIVKAAHGAQADLIVMSTHGIGASGRHALGSVAMKVLQDSNCPVLMVRIPEASWRNLP
jgi:nucleotide-binding universal stress UspA family protein